MDKDTSWLPFWEGFSVCRLDVDGEAVEIELRAEEGVAQLCGHCRQACEQVHERLRRRIRDLPLLGHRVTLDVHLQRLACPSCGHCQQFVAWLDPHSRLTRRLADSAAALCARMTVAHVAELLDLHWSTVRELDRRRLQALVDALPPAQPRRLAMDEFAVFKGHRYASVIIDADTRRVLYVAEGRTRKSIRPFFEQLGPEGCARIEAVAMDMNTAFDLEVRHHCRRARIVYDLFHVVAKYSREVVTRVRVDAANKLRQDKPARRLVKQAHWLLLRKRDGLSEEQQVHLDEILAANKSILTAYVMQEQLKTLWTATSAWDWRQRWKQWMAHAKQSDIPALQHFARSLKPYWRGIVSRVRWPMHTGQLEGINNRIKVIKRMAYGFRDSEYFFLKIKAAFPGNP